VPRRARSSAATTKPKRYYALDLLDRLVDPGDDDEGAAAAGGGADEARARRRAPPTTRLVGRGVDRYSVTHSLSFVAVG